MRYYVVVVVVVVIQNVRNHSPDDTPLFYKATSLLKGSSFCPLTKVGSLLYEITS